MNPDDWHGSSGGAMRHWRAGEKACAECMVARRRTTKGAELDRLRGNPRLVPLGEMAHEIIATTPRDQLARATGLSVHKLCRLDATGPESTVNRATRNRILSVLGESFWTPIGIQRRLRALHANGWSMRALAAEMGYDHPTLLLKLVHKERLVFVRRDMAERVIAAYDRVSLVSAEGRGATRARNLAARNGWAPPLAWDDIDDPDERPNLGSVDHHIDPVVVDRILAHDASLARAATVAERRAVVAAWPGSLADLERLTGWRADRYVNREDGAA